ncbi:phospholipase D family protein [Limosilactobacillus sp.]|jgi:hypothetical protein|uniref:phospholipase D family protein n=1 Tax=Limosilactobacillus sp. TaxID=2773925 RepID=UPI0025C069D8|nr:phospholipase D family protein [Limosilactobacillus sp.]MCH3922839.1 phospholipase D family protein [Limosilactobacillus sp.]MCH3927522.1 phospholipase D family protein [Limosilactobacillus sp.]
MLTIYDLKKQQMLYQPDFFELIKGYDHFAGVSFVGSFKIIEKQLLPRFSQIELILGLEDQRTGQNLNQFFNLSRKVKEIAGASDEFLNRIEDGTLQLRFTKDALFHSKYFIVDNETSFIIFNGSMNLTKKALSENHEMLWMYAGSKSSPADQAIWQAHRQLFHQNFTTDSTDYLNRKIIEQVRGKTKKEITAVLANAALTQLQDDQLKVHPEDIVQIADTAKWTKERYELIPSPAAEVVRAIYTPKGNKRRNQEAVRDKIKQITYQSFSDPQDETVSASSLYPQPMWIYEGDQILVKNTQGQFQPLAPADDLVTKADVVNFVDIIKSFKYNKLRDESHQALSAFMYLMTAPLIWKIRQIYRQSNYARSADQVPVSMVLIGRGTTGKTLLVRDYFKPFIGDHSRSVQYAEINGGTGSHTNKAVSFLGNYLRSKRFISPMIIDELNDNFLQSKVATNAIKQWSNTIEGIHNVNIFAMNHNAGGHAINNLEEITKRVYYLSFEAGWLGMDQQRYDYNILMNNINDHLYRYVVGKLNQRLNNLTGMDESRLIDDYLSLTKEIVEQLLEKFGLGNELADIIHDNYDYKVDRNRITWKMLIRDDGFKHVDFAPGDDQRFTVSKAIFNNIKGSTYENINQTLDNYFNMFPRELGIAIYQYDNGMLLSIDKFDHFIGEPLIRNYYNRVHQSEHQQDSMTAYLKAQAKRDAEREKREAQRDQEMQTVLKQLADQKQANEKKGLFSRLFHK